MDMKKVKGQFCSIIILSVVVLAFSVWAFIQGAEVSTGGEITQSSMTGSKSEPVEKKDKDSNEIDVEEMAESILSAVSFDTKLYLMEDAITGNMISNSYEDTKVLLYMGEGTCADELLILTAGDKDRAKKEIENVQKHLGDMQQSFQDYLPKEAKKIDNTIIFQMQNYVVACVTSDTEDAKVEIQELLR